jgi:hypothetical protein
MTRLTNPTGHRMPPTGGSGIRLNAQAGGIGAGLAIVGIVGAVRFGSRRRHGGMATRGPHATQRSRSVRLRGAGRATRVPRF